MYCVDGVIVTSWDYSSRSDLGLGSEAYFTKLAAEIDAPMGGRVWLIYSWLFSGCVVS